MTQETGAQRPDDATVLMPKSGTASSQAAATVINQAAASSVQMATGGVSISQRTYSIPVQEKPRSIALALAAGAATGLALFALTAWLLSAR